MSRPRLGIAGLLALLATAPLGCGSPVYDGGLPSAPPPEDTPLTGAALMHQLRAMRRAHDSLVEFHDTLSTLHYRGDETGARRFGDFVDAYLGLHLDPLLGKAGWHPELLTLDANLRVAKADLLQRLGQRKRAREVVRELEARFAGHEALLVDYPPGRQSTLEEALERLRSRRSWAL